MRLQSKLLQLIYLLAPLCFGPLQSWGEIFRLARERNRKSREEVFIPAHTQRPTQRSVRPR